MDNSDKPHKSKLRQDAFNYTLAVVVGQVGCLTVLIIFLTLFAGLYLDNLFGTRPWFTIILLVASVPVTLAVMIWVIRWTTSKMNLIESDNEESPQEEAEVGRNS